MLLLPLKYVGCTLMYLLITVITNTVETAQIYHKSRSDGAYNDDKQELTKSAEIPTSTNDSASGVASGVASGSAPFDLTVKIKCLSGYMLIVIDNAPKNHETGRFSGMIYPKGLSKNSSCLTEYRNQDGVLRYMLPLRSCNTMPQETEDGGIEFFNTIVMQPHLKLITDAGRSYHVRCSYKSRDAAFVAKKPHPKLNIMKEKRKFAQKPQAFISSDQDESAETKSKLNATDRHSHARSIHKYSEDETFHTNNIVHYNDNINVEEGKFAFQRQFNDENNEASEEMDDTEYLHDGGMDASLPMPGCHMKIYNAENKIANDVQIGDPLTIVINVDKQDIYGLRISNCIVRDGLGWGEQLLVGDDGCPMDNEIMGQFKYTSDNLAANVTFPAHKFPYTTSVYYQCNVQLCNLQNPDCQMSPVCSGKRPKRQTIADGKDEEGLPATIEVFSGLYVNENVDVVDGDDDDYSVLKQKTLEDAICVSQRTFAIAIAVAGLILMLAVVAAVLCIMAKRGGKTMSHSGSSIYSGPYTNTAFSHSS